jgi:hypothetical protein
MFGRLNTTISPQRDVNEEVFILFAEDRSPASGGRTRRSAQNTESLKLLILITLRNFS